MPKLDVHICLDSTENGWTVTVKTKPKEGVLEDILMKAARSGEKDFGAAIMRILTDANGKTYVAATLPDALSIIARLDLDGTLQAEINRHFGDMERQ